MQSLGIRHKLSTAQHPQTEGQTERTVRSMKQILRTFCATNPHLCVEYLRLVELSMNQRTNTSTHMSPFEPNNGFIPPVPANFLLPQLRIPTYNNLLSRLS